jgi:hypothetical protein
MMTKLCAFSFVLPRHAHMYCTGEVTNKCDMLVRHTARFMLLTPAVTNQARSMWKWCLETLSWGGLSLWMPVWATGKWMHIDTLNGIKASWHFVGINVNNSLLSTNQHPGFKQPVIYIYIYFTILTLRLILPDISVTSCFFGTLFVGCRWTT